MHGPHKAEGHLPGLGESPVVPEKLKRSMDESAAVAADVARLAKVAAMICGDLRSSFVTYRIRRSHRAEEYAKRHSESAQGFKSYNTRCK
jgi:hypothetical protein